MIDLERDCDMIVLSEEHLISGFDCGNADLNDFFNRDAILYKRQIPSDALYTRYMFYDMIQMRNKITE